MRTTILTALTVALLLSQADRGRAQVARSPTPNRQGFLNATPSGCRVTLSRNGVLTGSFMFPPGTLLSVVGEPQDAPWLGMFQFKFSGPFELRVLPAGDAPSPRTDSSAAVMSRAPIVLTGTSGVDLLIENVP
jgi:hypothetical protein